MIAPTIARVRPGKTAHAWVGRSVAELKGDDPLAPVTLIAPNYYAGRQTRWALARADGYVNVRSMLLTDVAVQLAGLEVDGPEPLTPVLEESAVRTSIDEIGGVFASVAHHRSLHQALLQLFRDMRRLEVQINAPQTEMARAALQAYAVFERLIERYADRTSIRKRATRRLQLATLAPRELTELGGVILYLPTRLDGVDARLLAAMARWVPLRAAFAWLGEDEDLANQLPERGAMDLEAALLAHSRPPPRGPIPLVEVDPPAVSIIRAPDPAEEIREVVRSVGRDLDAQVPLHHIAVLYRQTDPYAPLVRDSLTLAGLPWSALEGRTLADSRPGSALLCLLEVRQRGFAREAVLGWIDAAPRAPAGLPGSAWDRLSRAANVVRGSQQWADRLDNFEARQRELANQREAEEDAPAASALRHEAEFAKSMRTTLATLEQRLQSPVDASPWGDFVTWAEGLWTDLCGGPAAWPEAEQEFANAISRSLAELRQADDLPGSRGPTLSMFLATLRTALEGRARPVGSLGCGVLVGPVQSVTGLSFTHVYIVGMTEGAFPTPPSADPFFPAAADDPLKSRERQRAAERLAFKTALAAADGGRVTLSVPDSAGGRKAFPSPWLLELVSQRSGIRPLFNTAFRSLAEQPDRPWLRVVTSAINGLGAARLGSCSDLEDHRLQQVSVDDTPLEQQPIAARDELPLGAGLAATAARSAAEFTIFDGNVADLAISSGDVGRVLQAARRVSASGIEKWATCPFQFFLGRVLRVDATDRPEDGWTVDPLERGSLIHRILERFFKGLQYSGRLADLREYSLADHQLLEDIAAESFADLERRGVTGHPLVWENTSAAIRADLRTFLVKDERWRRDRPEPLRPRFFEQPFGMDTPGSWPPLELDVAGISIRFRGFIDRVDLDAAGRSAHLYDYKTGSTSTYGEMNKDPVMAGKHVQLALYRRAVLAAIPDLEEVGAAYWFVSSKGEFKMLPTESSLLAADRRLGEVLEGAAHGILGGAFPQVPGNETSRPGKFSWDNCVYCDFDRICPAGRDAVWERKQNAPGYLLHTALSGSGEQ